jgi:hypothetical protein
VVPIELVKPRTNDIRMCKSRVEHLNEVKPDIHERIGECLLVRVKTKQETLKSLHTRLKRMKRKWADTNNHFHGQNRIVSQSEAWSVQSSDDRRKRKRKRQTKGKEKKAASVRCLVKDEAGDTRRGLNAQLGKGGWSKVRFRVCGPRSKTWWKDRALGFHDSQGKF